MGWTDTRPSYRIDSPYVLFKKGKWVVRKPDRWHDWNSVIMHQCGEKKHNTHTFTPQYLYYRLRGNKCHCGNKVPDSIITLWYLHNMDKIGEKR